MGISEIAKNIGPVFPVDSVNKKPMFAGWQNSATRNPEDMKFPLGVGIKTGLSDGKNLVVVDIDNEVAEQYLRKNFTSAELDTYTVKTKRGKHYYFFGDAEDNFTNKIGLIVEGFDVRANGGFIISPPSEGYFVLNDKPIAPLPIFLKGIIGVHESKCHGMSPQTIADFTISSSVLLWELLRKIDPNLNRNDWLKVLSVAKHYFENSYEVAMYWSVLSEKKFPGEQEFETTWESLHEVKATPASMIYLGNEHQWEKSILPVIPIDALDDVRELALKLFHICKELLERKNRLTRPENDVLLISAEVLVFSLFANEKERIALPLPTGFGKSTLIRSLILLLKEEQIDKKLLVCVASHAEILESIEELKDMGVDGKTVGVFMSKDYKSEWDTPVDELEDKQVIYISHSRVYNVKDYEMFSHLSEVDGEARLVLWDESAQTTKGSWVSADDIEEQVYGLIRRMNKKRTSRNKEEDLLYQWLKDLEQKLVEEEFGQLYLDKIHFPQGFSVRVGADLKKLIDNSGCYVALSKVGDTDTVFISIQVRIPDEMSCVIFDASSKTRELIMYDRSIRHLKINIERDYSQCQIDCVNIKSSKGHLNIEENVDVQIKVLKEWIVTLGIKGDELLVVTQIPRYVNKGGKDINIDLPGRVKKEIPGVSVITWGSERGINQYAHLKYTANIGMKWRDKRDLQSEIQAQKRNLNALVKYTEINSVQKSEFLSEVQQWIPRTNMRISDNGLAKGTRVLFMHSNASELAEELSREVFPGLKVELYKANVATPEQKKEEIVDKVIKYLNAIVHTTKVSTVKLKEALGLTGITKDSWKTIENRVKQSLIFVWSKQGRSWVKNAAYV